MPYIQVKLNRFDNYEGEVKKTRTRLQKVISSLCTIRNKLDSNVKSYSISSDFRVLTTVTLPRLKNTSENMESFLRLALERYEGVDESVTALLSQIEVTFNQEQQKIREKYVIVAKIGLAVVSTIVTAAVVATAGPAVILAVSVVKTVVTTTADHLGDSYINNGECRIEDWGEYGKDLAVDVIVDVGLSAGGKLIGDCASGFLDDAIEDATKLSTRAGLKVVKGTISGASSEVTTGMMERYVEGFGDAVYDCIHEDGSPNFFDTVTQKTTNVLNPDEMIEDLVGGVVSGIGDGVECVVDEKLGSGILQDDLYSLDKNKRIIGGAVLGATTKTTSGVVKRGTKSIAMGVINEDLQLNEVVEDTFNVKSIATDIAGGATKQGIKSSKEPSFMDGMNDLDKGLYDIDQSFVNSMPAEDALRYYEKTDPPK